MRVTVESSTVLPPSTSITGSLAAPVVLTLRTVVTGLTVAALFWPASVTAAAIL